MILIISSEDDIATNEVITWLQKFGEKFLRISNSSNIQVERITINDQDNNLDLRINGLPYRLYQFKKIWYRRSWFAINDKINFDAIENQFRQKIQAQISNERGTIIQHCLTLFSAKSLNTQRTNNLNKLDVLLKCRDLGIKVPSTLITSSKSELIKFYNDNSGAITKNISPGVFLEFNEFTLLAQTRLVTTEMIADLEDEFHPMLFQEQIHKSFEIRSFFLDGYFYSSAIFSQSDEKTKVDFRNYNFEKPNRTPPYRLPKKMEIALRRLMKEFGLNSGSIDLIVNTKGEFIFLEVNPIGQFAQVSEPCNYHLEKKVAEYLIR